VVYSLFQSSEHGVIEIPGDVAGGKYKDPVVLLEQSFHLNEQFGLHPATALVFI
jgi:hypothetical protein